LFEALETGCTLRLTFISEIDLSCRLHWTNRYTGAPAETQAIWEAQWDWHRGAASPSPVILPPTPALPSSDAHVHRLRDGVLSANADITRIGSAYRLGRVATSAAVAVLIQLLSLREGSGTRSDNIRSTNARRAATYNLPRDISQATAS
jgi:hypothetical protein